MLRTMVGVLLLANLLSWAYIGGYLGFAGLAPQVQREPQRMGQQVNPEKLQLLRADGAVVPPAPASSTAPAQTSESSAPAAPPANTEPETPPAETLASADASTTSAPPRSEPAACWQAPGFSRTEVTSLRSALEREALLQGVWQLDEAVLPARWIVYLGPFPNNEELQRRRSELRAARIDHREVNNPALQPGLALGTYSAVDSAQQALRDVRRQGINNARVEQERPDTPVFTLRLPAASASQKALVEGLGGALAGRALQACP